MTRRTLQINPVGLTMCVDSVTTNADGSYTANGATFGACPVAPPVTGFDPNALTLATLKYASHDPNASTVLNVPVRVMDNVFGRLNALGHVVGYGYTNGSTVQIPGVGAGRLWQSLLAIPGSIPLGAQHQFKGCSYGAGPPPSGVLNASRLPIDVKVYEVTPDGVFMPINRIGAHKENVYMDGTILITFFNGSTDNQYWVPILPGHNYILEAKWHNPTDHGDMMFMWS